MRTRVGYCGGSKKDPTYRDLGDHTETIQIDYDPKKISYDDLLKVFWATHNPCAVPYSRQYMSAVFYHNDQQRKIVLASAGREAAQRDRKVTTQFVRCGKFYLAEDYHQKYMLQQDRALMGEVKAMYPEMKGFINSTVVARLNGYLSGDGQADVLKKEIDRYGLSDESKAKLQDMVRRFGN